MFICSSCLAKNFGNSPSPLTPLSRGKCEVCEELAVCYDIPSSQLIKREEPVMVPDEDEDTRTRTPYGVLESELHTLVPEGYEMVAYRVPKAWETFLTTVGSFMPVIATSNWPTGARQQNRLIILKKE